MWHLQPICPIHKEEMRREYVDEEGWGWTAYCSKCAKHYRLCMKTRYMDSCIKLRHHDGLHKSTSGDEFE